MKTRPCFLYVFMDNYQLLTINYQLKITLSR